jgi:hypothetical protein
VRIDADGLPLPDVDTLTKWRAEALQWVPNPSDWADFVVSLRLAAEMERRGVDNPELPPGMTAPERSLSALLSFLKQQHILMKCGAIGPLLRIHSAVVDLANGRASPMFKPEARRAGNPGKGLGYETIQGLAARTLDELVAAGDSPKDASKRVAGALKKSGREDMKDATSETVIKWREHLREARKPGPGAPENALRHFNESLWPGLSPRKKGEALLRALKQNAKAAG